jgi:hypothetical protein
VVVSRVRAESGPPFTTQFTGFSDSYPGVLGQFSDGQHPVPGTSPVLARFSSSASHPHFYSATPSPAWVLWLMPPRGSPAEIPPIPNISAVSQGLWLVILGLARLSRSA